MSHKVLIVDDEPQMRLAMTRVLTRAGYAVEAAGDGLEALEKMKKGNFPVVVTDVRMPKLDGASFLGRARQLSPASAILMITAYGTVESAVDAVRRGARDYILKPFPPEILERAVDEAIRAGSGVSDPDPPMQPVSGTSSSEPGARPDKPGIDVQCVSAPAAAASAGVVRKPWEGPGSGPVPGTRSSALARNLGAGQTEPADPARHGGERGAERPFRRPGAAIPASGVHPHAGSSRNRDFLTRDPVMTRLLERARRAAASEATVLIEAESGAGKELLARFIHDQSPRHDGPFAAINCAAFPHDLLESELFGHSRGAFTGAVRERRGHIEAAGGGTLLLDEIGEMSAPLQAKLLRVLQEREIQRLGEESPRRVDVRVIASTNRDLSAAVRSGAFREDLYFRLSVIPLSIPPLRERRADIPLLLDHFCRMYAAGTPEFRISKDAMRALAGHSWPGNVRELENIVHRAVVMAAGSELTAIDFFPEDVSRAVRTREDWLGGTIEQAEKLLIEAALERTGGNRTQAAAMVGISVRTLRNKLRDYRLRGEKFAAAAR